MICAGVNAAGIHLPFTFIEIEIFSETHHTANLMNVYPTLQYSMLNLCHH